MSEAAIRVRDLRKSYGPVEAVRGLSFDVARGEVFGLLGPNGAGKTTTVEVLEGYRRRSAGEVTVLGRDPEAGDPELKRRVGIVLQSCGFYPRVRVREAVEHVAAMYPAPRDARDTIELVGLGERADAYVARLSGGQPRRLDLALALVGGLFASAQVDGAACRIDFPPSLEFMLKEGGMFVRISSAERRSSFRKIAEL